MQNASIIHQFCKKDDSMVSIDTNVLFLFLCLKHTPLKIPYVQITELCFVSLCVLVLTSSGRQSFSCLWWYNRCSLTSYAVLKHVHICIPVRPTAMFILQLRLVRRCTQEPSLWFNIGIVSCNDGLLGRTAFAWQGLRVTLFSLWKLPEEKCFVLVDSTEDM